MQKKYGHTPQLILLKRLCKFFSKIFASIGNDHISSGLLAHYELHWHRKNCIRLMNIFGGNELETIFLRYIWLRKVNFPAAFQEPRFHLIEELILVSQIHATVFIILVFGNFRADFPEKGMVVEAGILF